MTTPAYTPKPGDQVRVRRYEAPCPELPGHTERKLRLELTGTIATVRGVSDGHLITLEGEPDPIFTGYQFSGQDPDHGCSWSLRTEVVPLADVAAHDQAELAAKVATAEREHGAALALWERARDGEVVARQRLLGAHERVQAAQRAAARHQADLDAADLDAAKPAIDLGALTERRKADRAVMAEHVAQLARSHGLSAYVTVDEAIKQASVDLVGPHGLTLIVRFRGNTPQCEPDTYVLSWYGVDEGCRLDPRVFAAGSVNPHHGHKATEVANGFRELAGLLARRFASIEDGSAFVQSADCTESHTS